LVTVQAQQGKIHDLERANSDKCDKLAESSAKIGDLEARIFANENRIEQLERFNKFLWHLIFLKVFLC